MNLISYGAGQRSQYLRMRTWTFYSHVPFQIARRRYRQSEASECRQDNGTTVSDSVATVVGPYLLEEQSLIEAFNGREKVSYLRYECTRKELWAFVTS